METPYLVALVYPTLNPIERKEGKKEGRVIEGEVGEGGRKVWPEVRNHGLTVHTKQPDQVTA